MAANREGSTPEFVVRRKGDHVCNRFCFPVKEITFFCFDCGEEVFKPQIAKHGRRMNTETKEWENWYICRTCHKAFKDQIERNRGPKREGWILTEHGWQMQGRFGTPTDETLKRRKKRGYD